MKPDLQAQAERRDAAAARQPAVSRWWLAIVAIGGDVLLTAAQIAPWALPIAVGVLIVGHPLFYAAGGAAMLLFIYLARPGVRVHGRPLTRAEAPQLFAELDGLAGRLQVAGRTEVMLDDTFNAGALQTRGLFGVVGTRRVLLLGIPLLAALSREHLLGVIAHEFGHFSRRHGRLGHWLYRARVGWIEFSHQLERSDLALDRAAAWCAERLVPYFSRLSFAHSRRCEYEADADAAAASGGPVFAGALTEVAVRARLWEEGFPRALARQRADSAEAPRDVLQRFAREAAAWPVQELEQWCAEALRETASWLDTHPPLADRLAALGEKANPVRAAGDAGSALLGESWPAVLEEFNAKWCADAQWGWRFEHLRHKHLLAALLDADPAAAARLPDRDRLARAWALRLLAPAEALAELKALHDKNPGDAAVTFAYGAALLSEQDPAGVALLEPLALSRAAFRAPVYVRLADFYRRSDDAASKRWLARLDGAAKRRAVAIAPFREKFESGQANATTLPAPVQAVLAETAALDPCVERAWLLEGREPLATHEDAHAADLEIHGLYLTLDPAALEREDTHLDARIDGYRHALEALVAADAEIVVQAYYTTEHLPPALDGYAALPTGPGATPRG